MKQTSRLETTSMFLHIMAMAFMLCDHLWGTGILNGDWLTCVGRLTFPIFAFLLVEGYFHTRSLKKYLGRLFLFALLSEIPFDLALYSTVLYPFHQNVLWSFMISLSMIHLNEKAKSSGKTWLRVVTVPATIVLGYLLGLLTFADYYGPGVLMALTFYFFRGNSWKSRLLQLLAMGYINMEMISGLSYVLPLAGREILVPQQAFAVLALIPIWLYRGRQGPHNRVLQITYYAFYPVHLLILALITG